MAIWRRRVALGTERLDRLFVLPSAANALAKDLGFRPTGTCSICFQALEGPFRNILHDIIGELNNNTSETVSAETAEDSHGFTWLIINRPPDRFESLVTDLHGACLKFASNGFGPQVLCALTVFRDRGERQLSLVYLHSRSTFYPFAPQPEQSRDNKLELAVKNVMEGMWLEPDLGRWFPVWDAPGL